MKQSKVNQWLEECEKLHLELIHMPLPPNAKKQIKRKDVWKRMTPRDFVEGMLLRMNELKKTGNY